MSNMVEKTERPIDRYPHSSLYVSDVAQQGYCEKQIDLWLDNPGDLISVPAGMEKETQAKRQVELVDQGTEFHESVTGGAVPLSWAEVEEMLKAGQSLTILETGLDGSYPDLPIAGRADAVCFDGWNASCVLEYKVTDSNQLYPNHRIQLLLYGYLLGQQTFNIDDLILVCVLVPRRNRGWTGSLTPDQAEKFVEKVRTQARTLVSTYPQAKGNWYHPGIRVDRGVEVRLRVFKYSKREAKRELDSLTDYWLGKREPKPATTPRKCEICLYNAAGLCSVALTPYRG